jgi:hypothetical protein
MNYDKRGDIRSAVRWTLAWIVFLLIVLALDRLFEFAQ